MPSPTRSSSSTTATTQLFDEERYDEAAAFQGLIEGDASLAELLYVQQLDDASHRSSSRRPSAST